jgi:hypothetical protein
MKRYIVCSQYYKKPVEIIGIFETLDGAMRAREHAWNLSKKVTYRGANCWIELK